MEMLRSRWRLERKGASTMLTPGALRQRRRRALESAEERRERLARDAERKRMKRLSESAEEAAWRRTVDAMRKKEKRMKERESKALMGQGNETVERISKVDFDSDVDSILRVVRPFPRKRRSRHVPGTSDYLISFPNTMADATEFGGSYVPPSLHCDVVGGVAGSSVPSTSRAPYNGTPCCPVNGNGLANRLHCSSAGDGSATVGCDFPRLLPVASKTSHASSSPTIPAIMPKRYHRRGISDHAAIHVNPEEPWGSDSVVPVMVTGALCGGVAARGDTDGKAGVPSGLGREREDFLDGCHDESLSAFSPEVIISEVKAEPSEDEEEQVSDNRSHRAALSALSPEVIIREVKPCPPPDTSIASHRRRELIVQENSSQELRGQWFASPALSIDMATAGNGHRDCAGAAFYSGRSRAEYLVGV